MNKLETLNELTYSKDISLNNQKKLYGICVRFGLSLEERFELVNEFKDQLGRDKYDRLVSFLKDHYENA